MRPAALALTLGAAAVVGGGLYLLVAISDEASPARTAVAAARSAPDETAAGRSSTAAPPERPRAAATSTAPRALLPVVPAVAPPVVEAPPAPPAPAPPARVTTPSGLAYEDTVVGTGPAPVPGQACDVHYTGWISNDGARGAQVDSSHNRAEPMRIKFQGGQLIKGFDEGLGSMRVGGVRQLWIPPDLGYGDRGAGTTIPAGASLVFEVELVGCVEPAPPPAVPDEPS